MKITAKDVLIPAAVLIAWLYFAQSKALNLLNYIISGVSLSWDGITPILNVSLLVQNVTNESYTFNSFVGNLIYNGTIIGNVSNFTSVPIPASSQTTIILKIRMSLLGAVSDIISLLEQGSGIAKVVTLNGALNASGILAPINLSYKIGS